MRRLLDLVVLAALMALGTRFAGWWAVPVVAAGYGAMPAGRRHGAPFVAAAAAAVAWGGFLAAAAAGGGRLGALADLLGALLKLPPAGVVVLTLAFPMLLAVTAAMVGRAIPMGGERRA